MTDTAPDLQSFPMPRSCPFAPPEQYAEIRDKEPVSRVKLPNGKTAWMVTSHELVRQVLADPRISSDRRLPGNPQLVPIPPAALEGAMRSMLVMDPPEHTAHRRLVINEFTVKRIQALRPRIQEIVDERIDALLACDRPADLVDVLARPVPALVICELLGVPYEDRETFYRFGTVVFGEKSTPQEVGAAIMETRIFLGKLVAAKEQEPGDDLLSRLIVKYKELGEGEYDPQQVVSTAQLLLNAGHETTTSMISLGTAALLEHPDQLAALVEDASLIPQAVEELLRYLSIADLVTFRTATADIQVGDVTIREGEGVLALSGAANWDPAAFAEPDKLDIHRNPRQHVAFGYGVHQCVGANLARLELEIVFKTLFDRVPGLRLATPLEELPFLQRILYGMASLPVTW
ncbi:cytochrome P450 [Streptomyces sp. 3211.6]|nr:cytochrome P450 [Streptomyces sp. 3211.6]RPF40449.1 cytochrome P450 [Streptomyces sp. Ag109_G2-6]